MLAASMSGRERSNVHAKHRIRGAAACRGRRQLRPRRSGYDPRTRALIEGPIAATLIRLAAPNMLVMLAQSSVGLVETYFIGKLGTDALAGVALVFPLVMLMQMMSAGAMGGGISSAIARALGAGRRADADALVLHALVIALLFGVAFTVCAAGRRPMALRRDGWQRRVARRGADSIPRSSSPARFWSGCSTRSPMSSAAPATWRFRRSSPVSASSC